MGLINIDPGTIIWTIITFLILLLILRKVAWNPILAMIDEREGTIRESLEEAEQARTDAEKTMREYEARLSEARKEAHRIIGEGKSAAEKIKDEIVAEARHQKQGMIEDARTQIEAERKKAIQDLRDSVATIAISAASKIIDRQLDAQTHQDIIERSLQDIGEEDL
ncbi:MAG: F0F1 ATP synthase subunit B [Calditrichota bacterium]